MEIGLFERKVRDLDQKLVHLTNDFPLPMQCLNCITSMSKIINPKTDLNYFYSNFALHNF